MKSAIQFGNKPISHKTLKWASLIALIAYPLGCIIQLIDPIGPGPDTTQAIAISGIGLALVVVATFAAALVAMSLPSQMMTNGDTDLDEREKDQRNRATYHAYWILGVMAVLFMVYMQMATGSEKIWAPSEGDHWDALFWGATLYVLVLPTAVYAVTEKAPPEADWD